MNKSNSASVNSESELPNYIRMLPMGLEKKMKNLIKRGKPSIKPVKVSKANNEQIEQPAMN